VTDIKQNNKMDTLEYIKEAHNHQMGKVCTKCNEHYPLSEFHKHKGMKDGLNRKCKSCYKEYYANTCPFKKWFIAKKSHAKNDGVEFTIEPTDIPGVKIRETITLDRIGRKFTSWEATEYPKVCTVFGVELDWGMNGLNGNSPSLDRIDSTKGYVKGNVMMISHLANSMKHNATLEQLNQFSRYHLFGNN
jgi:hypothetical protein